MEPRKDFAPPNASSIGTFSLGGFVLAKLKVSFGYKIFLLGTVIYSGQTNVESSITSKLQKRQNIKSSKRRNIELSQVSKISNRDMKCLWNV